MVLKAILKYIYNSNCSDILISQINPANIVNTAKSVETQIISVKKKLETGLLVMSVETLKLMYGIVKYCQIAFERFWHFGLFLAKRGS